MKSVALNTNWDITAGDEQYVCDLPHDVTSGAARDYSCAYGQLNGYIPAARAVFAKSLPQVKHGAARLVVSGACGYGDVFVNDEKVGTLVGYAPTTFYIDDMLTGANNSLRIQLFNTPGMTDKYMGLGIAGGVKLVVLDEEWDFDYNDPIFVKTVTVGDRTYADVNVSVFNNGKQPLKLVLDCTALNARGKRAGKKQRKLYLRAGQTKPFSVKVRINNPYEWSPDDPYMYTMAVKLSSQDGVEREDSVRFGIVSRALNQTRGLYINNRNTLLRGAYISHADAALGCASVYSNEKRRLEALKEIGYNAVHFVGCPTDAALDACDDVGMFAFVDLAAQLVAPKAPISVLTENIAPTEKVWALRNHPSVTLYGIADDVPECYGRNDGHEIIDVMASYIREFDDTRPITVSAHEFVPTAKEMEAAGFRKVHYENDTAAINAAREKNLFDQLTAGAFDRVDICGFNYLYPMYETEKLKRDRLIVGARTSSERAFESLDATEKNGRVIGDFNDCGIDYPGGGKLNEIYTTLGDIDAICCEKPQAMYKRILLGARNIAYITSVDPDSGDNVNMWNWPRYLGQKIKVQVYTSGDVVALYLDGRLVGRKLAGKVNKHIATFDVDYYPGTLEAVAYFKGVECARGRLKSAGSPKVLRLSAYEKNLSVSRGDLGFVTAEVCDRDGELVPYAMRTLGVTVTGGELVSFINADPMLRKSEFDSCPAYGGRALAVIRPDPAENKVVVKITGDGLLSSKISFKIKN
ncbi:MAG: DUF4982 domain-containing protein [Clostridiales bacterium]|nr:DUF4982 domain-containing protein [Clostridiales bacterium]